MSFVSTEMSPADIRACTCGNDGYGDGMFGGNGAWWIIILLLFGWGRNGFGGFGGAGNGGGYGYPCCGTPATQADLAAGFNNSAVLNNLDGIENALCQGFNGVNTAILQSGYNTQAGINGLSHQLAQCCCDTRAAISDVKYTIANEGCDTRHAIYNSTRDIVDNANANSRAILDFLTQDKIATLTAENQALKFQASQTAQNAYIGATVDAGVAEIIRRTGNDCPTPAYVVQPPQPVTFPTNCCGTVNYANNGCGCGSY
jgi:hypothetical protein